jgi:hypothetical protein
VSQELKDWRQASFWTRFNQRLIAAEKIEAAALLNVLVDVFDQ